MSASKSSLRQSVIKEVFTAPGKNLILVILAIKGEMHGYELLKEIEALTLGLWKPSHGHLYTLLNKMVEEGLLRAKEEFRGKIRRVKYALTRKGIERLAIANDVLLRILYNILRYHEILRVKLKEMAMSEETKMSKEVIEGYLRLLKQIRVILDDRIALLEKELIGT